MLWSGKNEAKIGSFSRNLQTHLYSQICTFLSFILSRRYFAIHCWKNVNVRDKAIESLNEGKAQQAEKKNYLSRRKGECQ